jgi:hypothetical protein
MKKNILIFKLKYQFGKIKKKTKNDNFKKSFYHINNIFINNYIKTTKQYSTMYNKKLPKLHRFKFMFNL